MLDYSDYLFWSIRAPLMSVKINFFFLLWAHLSLNTSHDWHIHSTTCLWDKHWVASKQEAFHCQTSSERFLWSNNWLNTEGTCLIAFAQLHPMGLGSVWFYKRSDALGLWFGSGHHPHLSLCLFAMFCGLQSDDDDDDEKHRPKGEDRRYLKPGRLWLAPAACHYHLMLPEGDQEKRENRRQTKVN